MKPERYGLDLDRGLAFTPRASRFTRERFDTLEPVGEEWIVHGLLPSIGIGFIVGPPGAGKSFLALDLLAQIASGRTALNRPTRQVSVAYLASESANGVRKRIKAWRSVHGASVALDLIPEPIDLRSDAHLEDLVQTLGDLSADRAREDAPSLGILAIDTLAASMPGGDENDGADMSQVLCRLQALSLQLGVLILLIAHFGKDETRGIRGWSGQTGAADLILTVQRDKEDDELRLVKAAKVKDGEDGDRFAFRLATVALGEDRAGQPITSATPVYEPAPKRRPAARPINAAEALVLKAVKLVHDHGPHHPAPAAPGVPRNVVALARADVRARAMDGGFAVDGERPNTTHVRFCRALQGLAAKGRIRIEGEWVWVLG